MRPQLGLELLVLVLRLPALVRHGLVVVRLTRQPRRDGKCWDWTEDQDEPGIDEISATTSMSLRVGDEDVVDDMTLGAEATWGRRRTTTSR